MSEVRNDDHARKDKQQEVDDSNNDNTLLCVSADIGTTRVRFHGRGAEAVNDDQTSVSPDDKDSHANVWHLECDDDNDDFILSDHRDEWDAEAILQAVVLIEDAFHYRSIQHKIESRHLRIYRTYNSSPVIIFRYAVVTLLHLLAFVEYPSSLTLTSDPRIRAERITVPCWLTQTTEFICLVLLLADNFVRMYLVGQYYFLHQKWNMGAVIIISISLIDWAVSSGMSCHELVRFRRLLRPYFILQNSSLMKKIVNCLRRTLPEVVSILLLLALHLYVFTLFGMLLFPVNKVMMDNVTQEESFNNSSITSNLGSDTATEGVLYFRSLLDSLISMLVLLTAANNPDVTMSAYSRNRFAAIFFVLYLLIGLIYLLHLLCTTGADTSDFSQHFYGLVFPNPSLATSYNMLGLYCFMNMLLAVIYNQFRGYFLSSMQGSLLRRRLGVRGAFEVLRRRISRTQRGHYSVQTGIGLGVQGGVAKAVVDKCLLPRHVKRALLEDLNGQEDTMLSVVQFQELFSCLDKNILHKQTPGVRWLTHPKLRQIQQVFIHKYFNFFGMAVAFVNLIIISVQLGAKYDQSFRENHSTLRIMNFTFAIYYLLEQIIKFWAFGWRRYLADKANIYDAVITLALIIGESVSAILFGIPYFPKSREIVEQSGSSVMWNILRMVNILIMARMLKIIPYVKSMSIVVMVLLDLMKNMKSFAGILVVIGYAFAIFGMQLFQGAIPYKPDYVNRTFSCGSYEQLEYWANNFDDFFASIIVLWDIMVVNNWQVFLEVFKNRTSAWSYLYFVAWWLLSVILVLNLFTALIMENFIMKWDRRNQINDAATSAPSTFDTYDGLTVSIHLNTVHSMFRDLLHEPEDNELLLLLNGHHYLKLE